MVSYTLVRSCVLPMDLLYKIEEHLWLRVNTDNSVTLGFTDMAQTTAGRMLAVSYRPTNVHYRKGKTLAVVESAKWLGPLRAPLDGVLLETNIALLEDAGLINRSPYHRGWVVRFLPDDVRAIQQEFIPAAEAATLYEAYMTRHNLDDCVHCEGYEFPDQTDG